MTDSKPPNGANRLGLWLGIILSAIAILGVIGSIFSMAFKVQSNAEMITVQDRLIKSLADQNSALQDRITKIEVSMNEIETQFCAQDIVRNLMHATDLRSMSMLWQRSFGVELPTGNAYYPTICNRRIK